jgi:hypothetical protein
MVVLTLFTAEHIDSYRCFVFSNDKFTCSLQRVLPLLTNNILLLKFLPILLGTRKFNVFKNTD